jgi:type I restriction enzyme S subunit
MTTETQKIPTGYKQTEIGVIPADWEVTDIGNIIESVIDNRGKTPPLSRIGYPLIEVNAIYKQGKNPNYKNVSKYVSSDTYQNWFRNGHPIAGDILVATVGSAGATAIMKESNGCIAQNIISLRVLSSISNEYFYYFTQSRFFKDDVKAVLMGGVQPSLKVPHIQKFKLIIPKSKPEQTAIATALSDTDVLIEKLEALIEKKKNIKQGAMQELLTGKRRLPGFSGKWETKKLGEVAEFERGRDLPKSDMSDEGTYKCIHYGQLFREYQELVGDIKSKTNSTAGRFYSKANDVLMPTSDVTPRGLATASCIEEDGVILGGGILVIRFNTGYDGLYFCYFISQNKSMILKLVKGSTVFHLYVSDLVNLEVYFPGLEEQTAIASVLSDMDAEIEKLESSLSKYKNIKQGMMQQLLTGKIRIYATTK